MSTTTLRGPFRLTVDGIASAVKASGPGVFMLGHEDFGGKFVVTHVGRSDRDITSKLKDLIGVSGQFKYAKLATSREAFEAECELFHRFRPQGNHFHPDRPHGTSWTCPHCTRGWQRA